MSVRRHLAPRLETLEARDVPVVFISGFNDAVGLNANATADVIEMKGSWVRNGAGPSAVGTPTVTADVGGIVTLHFAINGNKIEIQSDPAAANTYNYTIVRTQIERAD